MMIVKAKADKDGVKPVHCPLGYNFCDSCCHYDSYDILPNTKNDGIVTAYCDVEGEE